jgi:hypothetical protein
MQKIVLKGKKKKKKERNLDTRMTNLMIQVVLMEVNKKYRCRAFI